MKIFSFLKKEIIYLDTKINQSLSDKEIVCLVSKNLDFGEKSKLKFHCDLYGFSIQYTFFEDIEDQRTGCRPNDVFLSIMFFVKDNNVKIQQSISGITEYEFPDIEYIHSENKDYCHLFDFDKIFVLLLKAIREFIESRK